MTHFASTVPKNRHFIKFVHFVLEISATTISSGIDLSVQFIRHLLIFDAFMYEKQWIIV